MTTNHNDQENPMTDLRTDLAALADNMLCPWDANALRAFLDRHPAPSADRDEVAEVIVGWPIGSGLCNRIPFADAAKIADALLARFEMRRKA